MKHLDTVAAAPVADPAGTNWAEEEWIALSRLTNDLMVIVNGDGHILWANSAYLTALGWTLEQLRVRTMGELVHPQDLGAAYEVIESLVTGRSAEIVDFECRSLTAGGGFRWLVWKGRRGSRPDRLIGVAKDITDLRLAHQELHRKDDIFRSIVERAPVSIRVIQDGRSVFHNREFERIFGYETTAQAMLAPVGSNVAPEYREVHRAYRDAVLRGEAAPEGLEYEAIRRDGKRIWVNTVAQRIEWEGRPATQHVAVEISRRKKLESDLRQAQKLDAIGALAGGVAHDFNNILSVILGTSEMVLEHALPDPSLRDDLQSVREAALRGSRLTKQLLAFSRRSVLKLEILDLNRVVSDMEKMLRRVIGENIEFITRGGPTLHRVKADASQMEQVIINLAVNARDAMPQGGTLTIETSNAVLSADDVAEHAGAKAGEYVCLIVSDNGQGMDEETQRRIFEPFFTTKGKGKGTGLGLSTVYGIVRQLEGTIAVSSAPGLGSVFRVYLPRTDSLSVDDADPFADAAPAPAVETVMLVEDDADVRGVVTRNLRHAGYQVLTAAGGTDALTQLQSHSGALDLLITDVIMPGMSGRELVDRLPGKFERLPVLYISGYTDDMISHHGILEPGVHLLEKPFTREGLLRRVREVLRTAAAPSKAAGA